MLEDVRAEGCDICDERLTTLSPSLDVFGSQRVGEQHVDG